MSAGASLVLLIALLSGCGYTQLRGPTPAPGRPPHAPGDTTLAPSDSLAGAGEASEAEIVLPPGHPRITSSEDWVGRSFLDDVVGESDPLRFENLRRHPRARVVSPHAEITFRITLGGPAVAQVWQIRMDEFGWVTAAYWTQGDAGPRLDESLATRRAEFRLARESEAALREMLIQRFPLREHAEIVRPDRLRSVPIDLWPFEDPGRIDIEYRVETLGTVTPEEWPGGSVSAPLDLLELLIGTWDDVPPRDLREMVRRLARERPMLVDVAMLAEALVLAWEVEGYDQRERLDMPLRVGR